MKRYFYTRSSSYYKDPYREEYATSYNDNNERKGNLFLKNLNDKIIGRYKDTKFKLYKDIDDMWTYVYIDNYGQKCHASEKYFTKKEAFKNLIRDIKDDCYGDQRDHYKLNRVSKPYLYYGNDDNCGCGDDWL